MPVDSAVPAHRNEVVVCGRLPAVPTERLLPSGDLVTTFRLVVDRPPVRRPPAGRRPPTVDTVDCVIWRAGLRRSAGRWRVGDTVEAVGALRRRFWRSPTGPASRYEVEVTAARVVISG